MIYLLIPFHLQQDKRREMEYSKIHTLRLMLEQEKKTRNALSASNASQKDDILKSETKIRTLQEQLKQVCGEVGFDTVTITIGLNLAHLLQYL